MDLGCQWHHAITIDTQGSFGQLLWEEGGGTQCFFIDSVFFPHMTAVILGRRMAPIDINQLQKVFLSSYLGIKSKIFLSSYIWASFQRLSVYHMCKNVTIRVFVTSFVTI